jgi:hypothetical protein
VLQVEVTGRLAAFFENANYGAPEKEQRSYVEMILEFSRPIMCFSGPTHAHLSIADSHANPNDEASLTLFCRRTDSPTGTCRLGNGTEQRNGRLPSQRRMQGPRPNHLCKLQDIGTAVNSYFCVQFDYDTLVYDLLCPELLALLSTCSSTPEQSN